MELPVLLFQLHRSKVLLVGSRLVVKREEQSLNVELHKGFSGLVHGHCWQEVLVHGANWNLLADSVSYLQIIGPGHVFETQI